METSGKLATYRSDRIGRLKKQATYRIGKTPWWVLAVDLPADTDRSGEKSAEHRRGKLVKHLILPGEAFLVKGRPAFVLLPPQEKRSRPQPWILYAVRQSARGGRGYWPGSSPPPWAPPARTAGPLARNEFPGLSC